MFPRCSGFQPLTLQRYATLTGEVEGFFLLQRTLEQSGMPPVIGPGCATMHRIALANTTSGLSAPARWVCKAVPLAWQAGGLQRDRIGPIRIAPTTEA